MKHMRTAALLDYCAVCSGKTLPTFRDNLLKEHIHGFFSLEKETDRLSRNIGKESPLLAA